MRLQGVLDQPWLAEWAGSTRCRVKRHNMAGLRYARDGLPLALMAAPCAQNLPAPAGKDKVVDMYTLA